MFLAVATVFAVIFMFFARKPCVTFSLDPWRILNRVRPDAGVYRNSGTELLEIRPKIIKNPEPGPVKILFC